MKKILKKVTVLTMLVALISITLLGCGRREIDHEAIVSTVNGVEITLGLANFYARIVQAQEEMNHMFSPWAGEDPNPVDAWGDNPMTGESREVEIKDFIIDNLQRMFLMLENAEDFGVVISPEDMSRIEDAAALFIEQHTEETIVAVSGQAENVELFLKLMTVSERMTIAMGAGIDMEVSDEESVQRGAQVAFIPFTEQGPDGTTVPMEEADRTVLTLEAGIVLENAIVAGDLNAFEGMGDVYPITFGAATTDLDPDFFDALNALTDVGQYTDLVRTETGIFVGQLTSLFDEAATNAQIEQILEGRRGERIEGLLEEWRQAATITMDEEVWAQVSFTNLGVEIYQPEVEEDDALEIDWENLVIEDEGEEIDEVNQTDEDVDNVNGADEVEDGSEDEVIE
jgi:hypothetical protein